MPSDHGTLVTGLKRKIDSREITINRIERAGAICDSGRRHPTGSAESEVIGVQVAHAWVASDAKVASELEGVGALRPGEVVGEVVDGELKVLTVGQSLIEADESIPGLIGVAEDAITGACKAIVEAVYGIGPDHRGVADGEAFAVIIDDGFRRRARKEGFAEIVDVLQISAPEQGLFSGRVKMEVQPGDEGVIGRTHRSAKAVAGIVEAVADGEIVGRKITECLVEIVAHHRTRSDSSGIEAGDVLWAESPVACGHNVGIDVVVAGDRPLRGT